MGKVAIFLPFGCSNKEIIPRYGLFHLFRQLNKHKRHISIFIMETRLYGSWVGFNSENRFGLEG